MPGIKGCTHCKTRIAGIGKNPVLFELGLVPNPLVEFYVQEHASGAGEPLELPGFGPVPHEVQHLRLEDRLRASRDVLCTTFFSNDANSFCVRKMPVICPILVQIGSVTK